MKRDRPLKPKEGLNGPPKALVAGVASLVISLPTHNRKSAALGACDFFDLACSLWLESWEEHLLTSIAGVLRLRAINLSLFGRSARRFAQDDAFLEGTEKHLVGCKKHEKIETVTGSRDDKGESRVPAGFGYWDPRSQKRDMEHPAFVTGRDANVP